MPSDVRKATTGSAMGKPGAAGIGCEFSRRIPTSFGRRTAMGKDYKGESLRAFTAHVNSKAPVTALQGNQTDLLAEKKRLEDKLNAPQSYPDEDADRYRLTEIDEELAAAKAVAATGTSNNAPAPKAGSPPATGNGGLPKKAKVTHLGGGLKYQYDFGRPI